MPARKLLAFAAVYILWGSMYLAMKIGVESIPPLMLAGLRSLIAGAVLYGWGRLRGAAPPTRREWRLAALVGSFMFLGAHGGLFWAVQRVPSGVASLFIATIPIWMTITQYLSEPANRISVRTIVGIAGGAVGIYLLVDSGRLLGGDRIDPLGAAVLIAVAISWTLGSLVARRTAPSSLAVATGSYLLCGGIMLMTVSGLAGEVSAYNWLLRHTTLAALSTYAYVNPLVAVLLGWAFAGEALSARVVTSTAIILTSVALNLSAHAVRSRPVPSETAV